MSPFIIYELALASTTGILLLGEDRAHHRQQGVLLGRLVKLEHLMQREGAAYVTVHHE